MDTLTLQQKFLDHLKSLGRSHSTVVAYKKDLSQLFKYLQPDITNITAIKSSDLIAYIEALKNGGEFTLKTISRKINSLKTFFKFLETNNIIKVDVSTEVAHPKLEVQAPRFLSPLEYRALRDVARSNLRLYSMVEMLLQTGITIGELSRMKRDDIKKKNKDTYAFIESFSTKSERTILLNETIVSSLETYLAKTPAIESGYLFYTKTGNNVLIRNIRTAINRAFRKAGIKNATVNDIRNTFIVYQLQEGVDLKALAEYVGHQKYTTTERYLPLIENRPTKTTKQIKSL